MKMPFTTLMQRSSVPPFATNNCVCGESKNDNRWLHHSSYGVSSQADGSATVNRIPRSTHQICCATDNMYINNNNNVVKSRSAMDVDSSRTIAEDYIRYCLESHGFSWQNGQRDVTPNEIQRAMRALGDEFESRFSQAFDNMINQLHITTDTAYQTFRTIVDEIFTDGVNWGRVVALFGFGGRLAVRCVEQSMPQLVNSIVDWVSTYMDTNLKSWTSANNGWAGFLEFYNGGPEKRSNESWPSFKTICSYAAAGLGILTLGAFLSQKS